MKLIQKEWFYNCNLSQFLYNLDLVQSEVKRLYTSIVYFMEVLYFAFKKQCPSFNNWKMENTFQIQCPLFNLKAYSLMSNRGRSQNFQN